MNEEYYTPKELEMVCEKCGKMKEQVGTLQTYNFVKEQFRKKRLCEECYIKYKKNEKKQLLHGLTMTINNLTEAKTFGFSTYKNNKENADKLIEVATEFREHVRNSKGFIDLELKERFLKTWEEFSEK